MYCTSFCDGPSSRVDDKMFHRLSENFAIKVNMSVTHDMSGAAHSFDTVSIKTLNTAAWHVM